MSKISDGSLRFIILLHLKALVIIATLIFGSSCMGHKKQFSHHSHDKKGKLVVFAGVSGSGKSFATKALAEHLNALAFLEPEEQDWPELVKNSHESGEFSAMMAFRNFRVQNLFAAQKAKDLGRIVFVDSYYDKITSFYLGKPGMEWLIHPDDPYFEAAQSVTMLDTVHLPDADAIVLFDIDLPTWNRFLGQRSRVRDTITGFQENFLNYQKYIEEAVLSLALERNIKLIRFKQNFASAKEIGAKLFEQLQAEGVL